MAIKSTSLGMFKQEKYKKIRLNDKNETLAGHLSPATTDGLANNAEAVLSFFHVPSESDVFFKAFKATGDPPAFNIIFLRKGLKDCGLHRLNLFLTQRLLLLSVGGAQR